MLIVSSDYGIKQVPTEENCKKQYKNCVQCVHDPYCGWNRETGECDTFNPYLLQDPQGVAEGKVRFLRTYLTKSIHPKNLQKLPHQFPAVCGRQFLQIFG